jgi:hypothetical protein
MTASHRFDIAPRTPIPNNHGTLDGAEDNDDDGIGDADDDQDDDCQGNDVD